MKKADSPPVNPMGRKRTDWPALLAKVDAEAKRSEKWLMVGYFHNSTVTHIRRGDYPVVDPTIYEVTSRKDGNRYELWMRRRPA